MSVCLVGTFSFATSIKRKSKSLSKTLKSECNFLREKNLFELKFWNFTTLLLVFFKVIINLEAFLQGCGLCDYWHSLKILNLQLLETFFIIFCVVFLSVKVVLEYLSISRSANSRTPLEFRLIIFILLASSIKFTGICVVLGFL